MPDTVSTLSQLLADFADNVTKNIHPQQSRNLTASVFGYIASTDPTADNDAVDSAGVGAFFDTGSRWTNKVGHTIWQCEDGTSHSAIWRQLYPGPTGPPGSPGTPGAPGSAATIAVGSTTTLSPGSSATVTNSGSSSAAVFDFGIPEGQPGLDGVDGIDGTDGADGAPGSPGAAATIAVGSTTTLSPGSPATVTNVGSSSAAVFNFGIPKGDDGDPATVAALLVESGSSSKISDLSAAGTLDGTELLVAVQGGADVKMTLTTLAAYLGPVLTIFFTVWGGSIYTSFDSNGYGYLSFVPYCFFLDTYLFLSGHEFVAPSGGSFV